MGEAGVGETGALIIVGVGGLKAAEAVVSGVDPAPEAAVGPAT